ncbi:hypothetical protein H0E87_024082 [Populus deltoides]|uniref:Uncharacterized protein n=1 Tax=Populus deltoides TaxID=3696 RepID=A0A8T2X599_POPDE|nr:hypothetical protein H0E87_024082 [Populus deltoides]
MLKQNEKLKADNAELEKKLAYTNGKLDQLKEDMEQTRETCRQKTEDMLKQNEKLKADNAELEKKLAYANGKLDQLKEDMEKDRENVRTLQVNMDKQCNEINKQLRQLLQLPFQMNEFDTGATGPPIHHTPEGPAIEESSGLPQSSPLQGLAHGNNSEQPASANDDQFPDVH